MDADAAARSSARRSPGCSGASSSTTTTCSSGSTAIRRSRRRRPSARTGRNHDWAHLNNADVISMPDNWEYPWFAAWDLAFHCIPLALVDPEFAKHQLAAARREWYHAPERPDPGLRVGVRRRQPARARLGRLARLQDRRKRISGHGDRDFLERVFHKLLLNFTWWVNRKDAEGNNVFQGGFLGLDNIGVFDRSAPLPTGGYLEQSDGTAWMGMFCLNMLAIALELARENDPLRGHRHQVLRALPLHRRRDEQHRRRGHRRCGTTRTSSSTTCCTSPDGRREPLKVRSLVGLIPLFAVETIEPELLEALPDFKPRLEWFLRASPGPRQPGLALAGARHRRAPPARAGARPPHEAAAEAHARSERVPERLRHPLGQQVPRRSIPTSCDVDGDDYAVRYEPAESRSGLFGGNSNWRGPIWFPINYLLIEALQKFHHYYGDDFLVECPTGSGQHAARSGRSPTSSRAG